LQIAAGTKFAQKTKLNRHGDIKFLDELGSDRAEFVEVWNRLQQLRVAKESDICFQ